MEKVFLKKNKERALQRRHPWIFSGAIYSKPEFLEDGTIVSVHDYKDNFLACGHWHNSNIAVRILSFHASDLGIEFWKEKLKQAYDLRKQIPSLISDTNNCFRLVHGEGDGLPGLIIDIYDKAAVVQCHSIGMYLQIDLVSEALLAIKGLHLDCIYNKSKNALPSAFALRMEDKTIHGSDNSATRILENGHQFFVNWKEGQKTGFFLDQKTNRALLASYSKSRSVLNAFCYSGGFSVYALANGAKEVTSVDISEKATNWTAENVRLNGEFTDRHKIVTEDVYKFLAADPKFYDIVLVDPPAFAKSIKKRHNAVQAYKRLNIAAIKHVNPGGFLFTFSCSQVIDRELFYNTIVAAAIETGKKVKVLHHLAQSPDHPVNIFHPEGSYLKGLVLQIV